MPIFDSNLFIDTQSYMRDDMRIFVDAIRIHSLTTYHDELEAQFYTLRDRADTHHSIWTRAWENKKAEFKRMAHAALNSANLPCPRTRIDAFRRAPVKQLLDEIALAFNDEYDDDLASALDSMRQFDSSFARRIWGKLSQIKSFNIYVCDDCGAFVTKDYDYYNNNDLICETCLNDNYSYSECMGTYIYSNDAQTVYHLLSSWRTGCVDDYCTERYGNNNFHNHDGVFFSNVDVYYEARAADGYDVGDVDDDDADADDDDYDDYRNEHYLAGWHGTSRNFVEKNASQAYPALGAELEVYIPNRDPFVGVTRPLFENDLILESDGSLCSHHGIEMISHPLGREEWDEFAPRWLKHVQDYGGLGYNEPAGDRYGIHLTIHRNNFSPLAEARIGMFLTSTDNAQFVRAVAQRNQIYAADNGLGIGLMMRPQLSVVSPNGFNERYNDRNGRTEMKICGRGKFCPVNFKDDLAEFRIFQSTTNIVSFQKNLEFVWALWAWTKTETASGNSHNYKDFVLWLNKRQQRKQFPTLIKFLSKKVFYGTNFPPITSPWHSLMTHPTEDYAVEDMAA